MSILLTARDSSTSLGMTSGLALILAFSLEEKGLLLISSAADQLQCNRFPIALFVYKGQRDELSANHSGVAVSKNGCILRFRILQPAGVHLVEELFSRDLVSIRGRGDERFIG